MKPFIIGFTAFFVLVLLGSFQTQQTYGATVLAVPQGGTGSSSPYGILVGSSTTAIQTLIIGTNLTLSQGTLSASVSAGTGIGNVSTSTGETAGQLAYWTSTNATPALLGTVATGTITCAGTATCGAGSFVIGNSLTITGSAGTSASSTLLSDTNTFSGPTKFTADVSITANATSTDFFATLASTTNFYGSGLNTCNSGNVLTWSGGKFGCAADQTSIGTAAPFVWSNNYGVINAASSSNPIWGQLGLNASSTSHFVFASTTAINATSICLDGDTCRTTWPAGGSGTYSFTPGVFGGTAVSATGTALQLTGGLFASSTVRFGNGAVSPLFFDGSVGNLGLGTTSPWSRLTLDRSVANANTASSSITVTEYAIATTTNKTIDARDSNSQLFQIGSSATTITLTGFLAGTQMKLEVCNPNAVAGAITWATSPANLLQWAGGTAPTQTTTANHCDLYSFFGSQATSSTPGSLSKIFGNQNTF